MEANKNLAACIDFDFDIWMQLAKNCPTAFETMRLRKIEEVILCSRYELPLRQLQFRLDAERVRARTPLNACLKISSMMWDAFLKLNSVLNPSKIKQQTKLVKY